MQGRGVSSARTEAGTVRVSSSRDCSTSPHLTSGHSISNIQLIEPNASPSLQNLGPAVCPKGLHKGHCRGIFLDSHFISNVYHQ
jgi:hypothetical protein